MFNSSPQFHPVKRQAQVARDERRAGMREKILKAALTLFNERGFDAVTIRKIADRIGYSQGSLYHYFDGKEELFMELRSRGFDLLHERLVDALAAGGDANRLRTFSGAFVRFAFDQPANYELMFLTRAPLQDLRQRAQWAAATNVFQLLVQEIATAMDAGAIPATGSPRRMALLTLSATHGLIALAQRERMLIYTNKTSEEAIVETVNLLLDVLQSRAGEHR